eukprot:217562-Prorocentrum_minimum.AAC.1
MAALAGAVHRRQRLLAEVAEFEDLSAVTSKDRLCSRKVGRVDDRGVRIDGNGVRGAHCCHQQGPPLLPQGGPDRR